MTTSKRVSAVLLIVALASACATTPPLAPPAAPSLVNGEVYIDPRVGYTGPPPAAAARAFGTAIRALDSGQLAAADAAFADAVQGSPDFGPAILGRAIVAMHEDRLEDARIHLDRAEAMGSWQAVEVVAAELAAREGRTEEALQLYEALASSADPAAIYRTRADELRRDHFNTLFARAGSEPAEQAVISLREAIAVQDTEAARLLLARRLIELQRYDEARRTLDQLLLRGASDRDQLDALLAEIDYGKGRYQEAIARLEPLAAKDPARHGERLAEVKRRWSEANMPPRYHAALESDALTRSELATLIYWKVPPARFAKGLPEPPIAVDLTGATGREEMVRAMALGLFTVDPVTRTVSPGRVVTRSSVERILARLLRFRGIPACAAPAAGDPAGELLSCGIPVPEGDTISGREAARALDAISAVLDR